MRNFENYNPISVTVYFMCVTGIAMFCSHPVIILLSFIGSVMYFCIKNGRNKLRVHGIFFLMLIVMSLINPIFSHNGSTVLFIVNDTPITLEAALYGVIAAVMVVSVMYWFSSFTQIMTSDRLLYIFGRMSPKIALILSMALRYVPLFSRQAKKINDNQRAIGLYKHDNIVDRDRGGLRIFSVLLTWGIENGITTADSMAARGYGTEKRTQFSVFRFRRSDAVFLAAVLIFTSLTVVAGVLGALDAEFYPTVKLSKVNFTTFIGFFSYAILVIMPILIETEERIRWKYLRSRI